MLGRLRGRSILRSPLPRKPFGMALARGGRML